MMTEGFDSVMEDPIWLENNEEIAIASELPVDINDWNKNHVRQWMLKIKVDKEDADILYNQNINGAALLLLDETHLKAECLSLNARILIINKIVILKQKTQQQNDLVIQSYSLKPYPFNRFNAAHRYRENSILDVTETGPIDLIQPCHEFKAFTNTTQQNRIKKYTYEMIRFAAACMNSHTNGTIHFGVSNKPHGQILGVSTQNTDEFDVQQLYAIKKHFKLDKQVQIAKRCIKPPRFVEVLKADMTSTGKCVIEVDIEPSSIVCEDVYFNTYDVDKVLEPTTGKKKKKKGDTSFFIRDGSSSRNLITSDSANEYKDYIKDIKKKAQLRKDAEEKCLSVVKTSVQGSKLYEMITGGTQSLDRSHFAWYILVTNKSHRAQLENLDFLHYMNLVAVLDFDPQSAENGLNKLLKHKKMCNVHSPAQYKITGEAENIANRLKLTKNTSWVFCNGSNEEEPSDADHWLTEKGSSVHDVVSFLCRKDVLPQNKFLVIFLLLDPVSDGKDLLIETLSMFLQELKGGNQILCISDNETSYAYWKDLVEGRCTYDISTRCIYELSFAEVNGTVLSLWSENRKSSRFLPCGGNSKVVLSKKTEESLETLSVLCVNQCDGGNEDKQKHEEIFYKGGKVSWWNFYFSEQPGSMPFIKRDKLDYIINTIIPDICSQKRVCEFFNIFHLPGCGGTTLAMHVLWTLKDKFRCAVLKDTTDIYTTVAEQVVQLLTYETKEQSTWLPVLLMIDDFQDISNVKKLQRQIEKECLKQNIFSKSPQVIIVHCIRVESCEKTKGTDDAVFIGNSLSEKEQKLFEEKLKVFKRTKTNTKTFYGFMILKENFSFDYIQSVVKNILKGFNFKDKHAQLFAVLVLLEVYCKNAVLSVSTCEEFLGLQTKPNFEIEDGFEKFSTLLRRCTVDCIITFEGVRVIHSKIAQCCLKELLTSHALTKAEITNLLLKTDLFYEYTLGKQKLKQDIHNMLVRRQYTAEVEDSLFSPLIQDIMNETPRKTVTVLDSAAKCYRNDAVIFQLLARYYYIEKQDFTKAKCWATKAKDHSRENSFVYICDTVSQVLVRELKHALDEDNENPIKPDRLDRYLTLAESAAKACKETQQTANKEAMSRLQRPNNYNTYNTSGHLSELQMAATIIKILQNIPFNLNDHNNCLTQIFLGKITIEDLSRENPKLNQYCGVLQKHKSFLLQLKDIMKQHFVFFDIFFVNLIPFFAGRDKQKELIMCKVSRYFQKYTDLFCKINWSELVKNEHMNHKVKIEQTRQCLEKNKGDSYTGLLKYLYKEDSASTLEEIIQQYRFILDSKEEDRELMDNVNFIYANIILANINPESQYIMPYQNLRKLLFQIIDYSTPSIEILPLLYITVLLIWHKEDCALSTFVSQMKKSYSTELKPVSNGKRAAVHFYLGKDEGYGSLISHRDINSCLASGQDISTQWDDEKIWQQVRDSKKLYRVSGEICKYDILAANVKVEPMFRSQLLKESGTRVTYFIGFSMNGPVAFDIDFES